jgi:hypothetical protein
MGNVNRVLILLSVFVIAFTLMPFFGFAQVGEELCPCGDCDRGCPIDGGLSVLIAAGVGYGIKKVRDEKKNKMAAPTSAV